MHTTHTHAITGLTDQRLAAILDGMEQGNEDSILEWTILRENWKIHGEPIEHSYSRLLDLHAGASPVLDTALPLITFSRTA